VSCGSALKHSQEETVYPEIRSPQPPGGLNPALKRYAQDKNAFLAVMLSFVPSFGQAYNNDWKKMFALWGAIVVLILIAGSVIGALPAFLIAVVLYGWSIIDAYRVAKREKALW
jgi:NhaP-type Na+/H+ or K+/H+ antiporter